MQNSKTQIILIVMWGYKTANSKFQIQTNKTVSISIVSFFMDITNLLRFLFLTGRDDFSIFFQKIFLNR